MKERITLTDKQIKKMTYHEILEISNKNNISVNMQGAQAIRNKIKEIQK